MTEKTRWRWRMRMPSARTVARRSCRSAASMPPRRAARSCSAAVNTTMSSRTFQTVSSASVWPSARRRWMRSICRSRPVPASPSDTMTPIVCSSPSVRRRRAPSPLLRIRTSRLGTARSALIMSSSAIPMRALTLRRQRPTAAAAIRCIITAATACASAVTGARTMYRRGRGKLSPAAHAVCWS